MKSCVIILLALVGYSMAASYGEKCTSNDACDGTKMFCWIDSPSCGAGRCKCIPGYAPNPSGNCKKESLLGEECTTDSVCTTENALCEEKTCQCAIGYKTGLTGGDCVSNLKTERYGGECHDNVQCHYNMVCTGNKCTCHLGYRTVGDYDCIERSVGDKCVNNTDCARTPNTYCEGGQEGSTSGRSTASGTCSCRNGYQQVTYMVTEVEKAWACIPSGDSQVGESQTCSRTIGASDTKLCKVPFVCRACTNEEPVCQRVKAAYSAASSPATLTAVTMLFMLFSLVVRQ